jgi:inositol-pentakisphosphate 2-kinase
MLCRTAKEDEVDSAGSFTVVGEGAANAVFRIDEYDPTLDRKPFVFEDDDGRVVPLPVHNVVRIPKQNPKSLDAQQVLSGLNNEIKKIFGSKLHRFIIPHQLITIERHIVEHMDGLLQSQANRRKSGHLLIGTPNEKYVHGIFMRNMEARGDSELMIEFKPKWLSLSPSQPNRSYRCRTCAMQALRRWQSPADPRLNVYACPLDVVCGNRRVIQSLVSGLISAQTKERKQFGPFSRKKVEALLTDYLAEGEGHELLLYLREKQVQLDPLLEVDSRQLIDGIRHPNSEKEKRDLRVAMTLRDCSIYLKSSWKDPKNPTIECQLGDLDYKHEAKVADWVLKDVTLLKGGWFVGKEGELSGIKNGAPRFDREEKCRLARTLRRECRRWW